MVGEYMKLFGNKIGNIRATNQGKSCIGVLVSDKDDDIKCSGYTSLAYNPEVFTACRTIAGLISSMPIMLMDFPESWTSNRIPT